MRLLLLTEFFPTSGTRVTGGVEARCFYVVRHLNDRHEITVLANERLVWASASFSSLPSRLAFVPRVIWRGLWTKADLIEGSNAVVFALAWLLGRLKRVPVVFFYPDVLLGQWTERFGVLGLVGELVERFVLRLPVDQYITISHTVADKLVARGVPRDTITVVPCGFEPELIDQIAQEQGTKSYSLCAVSRLVPYKRVDVMIEAIARLVGRHPDISLALIGRGPDEQHLRALADRLGVADRVEFIGFVPDHVDVLRLMARSHVFVIMSEVEGFGIVLAEAMALGVPYAATDIAVLREVSRDGEGGVLIPPGDVGTLASELSTLLGDPARRASLGAAAREAAAEYRWPDIASRTEAVYEKVLRSGRRRRLASRLPRPRARRDRHQHP